MEPNYTSEDLKDHIAIAGVIKDSFGNILIQKHNKYGFITIPIGKAKPSQTAEYGLKEELFEECEEDVDEISLDDCYEMLDLDIENEYTQKEVVKAYRNKARDCHPDKHEDNEKEKYAELFKNLNKHYRFLVKKKFS